MIVETNLRGTDYSYILGREFVVFSNGVTMSLEEFKTFHSKGILVKKVMTLARVPKRLSDYKTALETGVLTPVYMPVRTMQLNAERDKKKKKTIKKETIIEAEIVPEKIPEKRFMKIRTDRSFVILYCMLFIAAGSALMSIYHATAFLVFGGKPFLISLITAILLVMFASTGFTAARYFSEQRGMAKIFSLPFFAITIILICYIAFSTTSVSYDQFRHEEAAKVVDVQKEINTLEMHKEVQKSIAETESYIRGLEQMNMEGKTEWAFARHQKMLSAEREKLQKLRDRSFELRQQSAGGTIEEKQQSIASIYDFMMDLFGIDSRILRFVIYVIPAVFYDVVAPFGFTVVFFLIDTKQKGEEDETC